MGTYDDLVREYRGAVKHIDECIETLEHAVRIFVFGYLKCPNGIAKTSQIRAVQGRTVKDDYIMTEDGTMYAVLQLTLGDADVELQVSVQAKEQGHWRIRFGAGEGIATLKNETELTPIFEVAFQDLLAQTRRKVWGTAPESKPAA